MLAIGALGVAVAVFAVTAWILRPGKSRQAGVETSRREVDSARPAPSTDSASRLSDPEDVLLQARVEAAAWHPDAVLLSVEFEPVVAGTVDLQAGGHYRMVFGEPVRGRLGPGSPVGPDRLAIIVDASGRRRERQHTNDPGSGIEDPNCPFSQAWKLVGEAGAATSGRVRVRYVLSPTHKRAVWDFQGLDDPTLGRTLDGRACRFLRRPPELTSQQ